MNLIITTILILSTLGCNVAHANEADNQSEVDADKVNSPVGNEAVQESKSNQVKSKKPLSPRQMIINERLKQRRVRAQQYAPSTPPPRGTGTLVSGIILTATTGAVAGMGLIITAFGGGPEYFYGSLAVAGVGLGFGIPMIVSGKRQRRVYKDWSLLNEFGTLDNDKIRQKKFRQKYKTQMKSSFMPLRKKDNTKTKYGAVYSLSVSL